MNTRRGGPLNSIISEFRSIPVGTSVTVRINPSFHSGLPPSIYHGQTGKVVQESKTCVKVCFTYRKISKCIFVNKRHVK